MNAAPGWKTPSPAASWCSARWLAADGLDAWAQVIGRGYEGLVAKDEASAYEGGRTTPWVKVKQKNWTVEDDGWRRRISVAPPDR